MCLDSVRCSGTYTSLAENEVPVLSHVDFCARLVGNTLRVGHKETLPGALRARHPVDQVPEKVGDGAEYVVRHLLSRLCGYVGNGFSLDNVFLKLKSYGE